MLYLLDANVLITANRQYYPIDQVPEFWEWVRYCGDTGQIKIPAEIMDEMLAGRKEKDPLLDWLHEPGVETSLLLDEAIDPRVVSRVVKEGYAPDLSDDEIEQLGRDPFLIAYAMADAERCVVTIETSSPKKTRQNRKIPDVCKELTVRCCDPFTLNRELHFRTAWRSTPRP